jgi:hypothetical protein
MNECKKVVHSNPEHVTIRPRGLFLREGQVVHMGFLLRTQTGKGQVEQEQKRTIFLSSCVCGCMNIT